MNETIISVATPVGQSAIGVLRLSGPRAVELTEGLFRSKTPLSKAECRAAVLGRIIDPATGALVDTALATVFRAPASYTGEDMVELGCHGSPAVLDEALRLFTARGARMARPGEYTERAYLNGKMDLNQAEAVNDIIRAHTRLSLLSARSQLEGGLSSVIGEIHSGILDAVSLVAASIDHGDLEEQFYDKGALLASIGKLAERIAGLVKTAPAGKMARDGMKIAIVGAPNTGKSSLMNLMLREDRVIVSDIAGTTRDTVEDCLNVRGVPVRLFDTAGIREPGDELERKGIDRSRRAMAGADLRVMLFDASRGVSGDDREIFRLAGGSPCLYALNKSDLPALTTPETLKSGFGVDAIGFSAKSGLGLDELEKRIEGFYYSFGYDPQKDVLVTNARQEGLLKSAAAELETAGDCLRAGRGEELAAHHLQKARASIEEITGKTADDSILDRIFSKFCIGK